MSSVENAVDQVTDAVESNGEEILEAAETVREVGKGVYVLAGFAVGFAVGVVVADRWLDKKYSKIADDEITEMREVYFRDRKDGEVKEETEVEEVKIPTRPEQEKPDLGEVVKDLGYATRHAPEVSVPGLQEEKDKEKDDQPASEADVVNIFEEEENTRGLSTDVWEHDKELASRTKERPYVIHRDEFKENDYDSTTVTYYIQDDTLADERDQRMSDIDAVIGLENLEKFGHGSQDANVVYVRNDRLMIDFEVLRSGGSYIEEVLGVDEEVSGGEDEIQHSIRRRRPRLDDEHQ